jgi:hypothetical protein
MDHRPGFAFHWYEQNNKKQADNGKLSMVFYFFLQIFL